MTTDDFDVTKCVECGMCPNDRDYPNGPCEYAGKYVCPAKKR